MPRIRAAAHRLDQRRGHAQHRFQQPLDHAQRTAGHIHQRRRRRRAPAVRIAARDKRIGRAELIERLAAGDRPQMDHLVRGKQILLLDREVRVGQNEVRADGPAPPQQPGQHQQHHGHRPNARSAGHDEQIEIAVRLEVAVRNAARQRHEPRERQRAHQPQREPMPREEQIAARFAPPALGDEIAAPRRKEKPVAVLDDVAQQLAAFVDGEDLRPGLVRLDQRVMELLERERVVEQRRVDHGPGDGDLSRRHHLTPP